jgi:crotonobetainyl-CoA:carnitine CoA-transferase CaiB-like acyl-CoA transferase
MAAIDIQRAGATAILTMNRPEQRNALDYPMREAFAAAVAEVRDDAAVRAVFKLIGRPELADDPRFNSLAARARFPELVCELFDQVLPLKTTEILKEFSFSDDEIDKLVAIGAAGIGAHNEDSGATSTRRAT